MNKKAALNITSALLVVLCIDLLLVFAQYAMADINPASKSIYLTVGQDILSPFLSSNRTALNVSFGNQMIGGAQESTQTGSTGESWTDTFIVARNWLFGLVSFPILILAAPGAFLFNPALGLPLWFAAGIGALWYGLTLFLLVSWLAGRT